MQKKTASQVAVLVLDIIRIAFMIATFGLTIAIRVLKHKQHKKED
ncbi:hypothetical protein [Ligilactobacillus ceti]|nr:hypothetical protein [Ligilactobacillus ceti]